MNKQNHTHACDPRDATKETILVDIVKRSFKKKVLGGDWYRYGNNKNAKVSLKFIPDRILDEISNMSMTDMNVFIDDSIGRQVIDIVAANIIKLTLLEKKRRIAKAKKAAAIKRNDERRRINAKRKKSTVEKLSTKLSASEFSALKKLIPGLK